jgi:hypothetical protein
VDVVYVQTTEGGLKTLSSTVTVRIVRLPCIKLVMASFRSPVDRGIVESVKARNVWLAFDASCARHGTVH